MQAMQEGQTIKHGVYGLGIVTASDGERTAVDFDDHGPKLFVTSIMTAELIGEALSEGLELRDVVCMRLDASNGERLGLLCLMNRTVPLSGNAMQIVNAVRSHGAEQ